MNIKLSNMEDKMEPALKIKMNQVLNNFLKTQSELRNLSVDEKKLPIIKSLQSRDLLLEALYQAVAAEVSRDFYLQCSNLKDINSLQLQLSQLMHKYGGSN